jgi:hypothetical protein
MRPEGSSSGFSTGTAPDRNSLISRGLASPVSQFSHMGHKVSIRQKILTRRYNSDTPCDRGIQNEIWLNRMEISPMSDNSDTRPVTMKPVQFSKPDGAPFRFHSNPLFVTSYSFVFVNIPTIIFGTIFSVPYPQRLLTEEAVVRRCRDRLTAIVRPIRNGNESTEHRTPVQ